MASEIFKIDDNNVAKDNNRVKANKTIKKIFKFRKSKLYYNIIQVLLTLDLGIPRAFSISLLENLTQQQLWSRIISLKVVIMILTKFQLSSKISKNCQKLKNLQRLV